MKTTTFRLRCEKCGWVYRGPSRIKVCPKYHINGDFGHHVIWCRGKMFRAPLVRKDPDVDEAITHAQARLDASIAKVKSAVALVDRWQKKLARLNRKRAEMVTRPAEAPTRIIAALEA